MESLHLGAAAPRARTGEGSGGARRARVARGGAACLPREAWRCGGRGPSCCEPRKRPGHSAPSLDFSAWRPELRQNGPVHSTSRCGRTSPFGQEIAGGPLLVISPFSTSDVDSQTAAKRRGVGRAKVVGRGDADPCRFRHLRLGRVTPPRTKKYRRVLVPPSCTVGETATSSGRSGAGELYRLWYTESAYGAESPWNPMLSIY